MYKELLQLNQQKTTQFKNSERTWIDTFSREDGQMACKHMERYLPLLVIR